MGIENLLEETPEAYYWIGFLMADGYFKISEKAYDKQLQLSMSSKDAVHMNRFCGFINIKSRDKIAKIGKKEYRQVVCSKRDAVLLPKVIEKFKINKNKTFNPPIDLEIKNDDLFISFLIGFIDGDGCIRKNNGCIIVACEKSWSENLNVWFSRLWYISKVNSGFNLKVPLCKINNSICRIQTNHDGIKNFLLEKIVSLNIPVLKRKWDNIKNRYLIIDSDKLANRNAAIYKFVEDGKDVRWISNKMDINYKNCWRIVNEFKISSRVK